MSSQYARGPTKRWPSHSAERIASVDLSSDLARRVSHSVNVHIGLPSPMVVQPQELAASGAWTVTRARIPLKSLGNP